MKKQFACLVEVQYHPPLTGFNELLGDETLHVCLVPLEADVLIYLCRFSNNHNNLNNDPNNHTRSVTKGKRSSMNGENRSLLTNEPVEFDK